MSALWAGTWPEFDWLKRRFRDYAPNSYHAKMAGKPLAGRSANNSYIGVLWKIKGDLDFWADDLDLPRHNVSKPCALCAAESSCTSTIPWDDLSEGAAWVSQTYSNAQWRLLFPLAHLIFSCQPGIGIWTMSADYMHDKHLGFDQYFLSSVLVLLCFYMLPGTPAQNLVQVWGDISAFYTSDEGKAFAKKAYGNLRLTMFCNPEDVNASFPKLKGRAAEISVLTCALNSIFPRYIVRGNKLHRAVKIALNNSSTLEQILMDNKQEDALPLGVDHTFKTAIFDMLAAYKICAAEAIACVPPRRLFNITVKSHYLCHIALTCQWLNPRLGWCYGGEDLMHRLKILAASCCRARSIYKVFEKMNEKYLWGLHYEYTRERLRIRCG